MLTKIKNFIQSALNFIVFYTVVIIFMIDRSAPFSLARVSSRDVQAALGMIVFLSLVSALIARGGGFIINKVGGKSEKPS